MRICQGGGGILGIDCFNERDCLNMLHDHNKNNMEAKFWKLVDIIEKHGIDVSELKRTEMTAQQRYDFGNLDDLPF